MQNDFEVLILGGGAAGLMCAIEAGRRGRRVAVLERAERIGKKILISGGGRCNFTNLHCGPDNFISANPHFVKSALARYTPADFLGKVQKQGIAYHEKAAGQLFCDGSAQQIVSMLAEECRAAAVAIFTGIKVERIAAGDGFAVRAGERTFAAKALVIATGGLSIPKMGATSFGYDVARQFGIRIIETRPALVPLTFQQNDLRNYGDLAGVSADVTASAGGESFREKMLITHRGLSGPAILQASSYWKPGEPVMLDLAPEKKITEPLRRSGAKRDLGGAKSALRTALPARLADRWLELHAPQSWTNAALDAFEDAAHRWQIIPAGTEGYDKAEVTAGGVDTHELSARTMESRKTPGLYFIGEVVDVTGQLGGYNFQWAWASGYSAGQAV